jgi:hypothetical protein
MEGLQGNVSGNKIFNSGGYVLGGCFAIRWLRTTSVPFSQIYHYKNPLNNDESIRKSRDSQEIPYEIGKEFC